MRAWTPCTALLFAALIPASGSAQSIYGGGQYYGNTYISSEYEYPYARTQDGYQLATRPATRDPYTTGSVSTYGTRVATLPQTYEDSGSDASIGYAIAPEFQRQVVAYSGTERPGTVIVDT